MPPKRGNKYGDTDSSEGSSTIKKNNSFSLRNKQRHIKLCKGSDTMKCCDECDFETKYQSLLVILYNEEWNYDELNIICIWKNYDEMIIQSILMKCSAIGSLLSYHRMSKLLAVTSKY